MRLKENDVRVGELRKLYRREGRSALILTRTANLSWLLGGRVQVGVAGDTGICKVIVTDQQVFLLTSNIEGGRLAEEEVGTVPEIVTTPWVDAGAALRAERELAGSSPLLDTQCEEELRTLRSVLLPEQQEEARHTAALCARAMERACGLVRPGLTEFEISGLLAGEAIALGLQPIVLFTAVDERIKRYRHAISGQTRLKKIAMLSMGAHQNGLFCSITRFLSFGQPEEDVLLAQERTNRIAAMLYTRTRPEATYDSLYHMLEQGYGEAGVPQELLLHHQGGLGGFQVRECRVTPGLEGQVLAGQLYAWNPSVTGFKAEDTLLVGAEGNELLTDTPSFPHKAFACGEQVWNVPQILIL